MSGLLTVTTTTVGDIIDLALRDAMVVGEGQSASAKQTRDLFAKLNWMIGSWRKRRWLVYHTLDLKVTSTGKQSYTIGPNGDIPLAYRPDKLQAAFFRQTTSSPFPVDYPLEVLTSRVDYNNIALKTLVTFTKYLFYDPAFPLGNLYPYPVMPSGMYELHVSVMEEIAQFTGVGQEVDLPGEYMEAIETNLAVRACLQNGRPVPGELREAAAASLVVLRQLNTQMARLKMPRGLTGVGAYNVYSDQST